MVQITHLIEVMLIDGRGFLMVSHAAFGIKVNIGLHAEMVPIAFMGPMHLGITLFSLGSEGSVGFDDRRLDQRIFLYHDARIRKPQVDGAEELARRLVLCQQMMEVYDGVAVRDGLVWGVVGQKNHGGHLIERIFHGAIAQVAPRLHTVNAQHGASIVGVTAIRDNAEHFWPR